MRIRGSDHVLDIEAHEELIRRVMTALFLAVQTPCPRLLNRARLDIFLRQRSINTASMKREQLQRHLV
jgi:hypothetical protein